MWTKKRYMVFWILAIMTLVVFASFVSSSNYSLNEPVQMPADI